MSEHTEIWLEPKCAEDNRPEGRQWCQDAVFETCCECGAKPTRYIRADIVEAERQRQAEVMEEVRKLLRTIEEAGINFPGRYFIIGDIMAEPILANIRALLSKLGGE